MGGSCRHRPKLRHARVGKGTRDRVGRTRSTREGRQLLMTVVGIGDVLAAAARSPDVTEQAAPVGKPEHTPPAIRHGQRAARAIADAIAVAVGVGSGQKMSLRIERLGRPCQKVGERVHCARCDRHAELPGQAERARVGGVRRARRKVAREGERPGRPGVVRVGDGPREDTADLRRERRTPRRDRLDTCLQWSMRRFRGVADRQCCPSTHAGGLISMVGSLFSSHRQ